MYECWRTFLPAVGATVTFEWNEDKARHNIAKHGISFELASRVWEDPLHTVFPDRIEDGEQRWHAIGVVGVDTVLVVAHVYRSTGENGDDERIRIISARKADRRERRLYEQEALD
jgi:uncharacterized protein